ncbi:hypothetical protein GCM10023188_26480 [Pontibacter saemangeumensis]|uniref:DUF4468 domain-containing protein n=1 Tax=Pontibacter saemangeumensis TaxID=1084525 RepID=A0ABP8LSB9_9BACT
MLALLLTATTATAQENFDYITASSGTEGETGAAPFASNARESRAVLQAIRPVTVTYKDAPWFLLVVDIPDEKQVVHFTQGQLEAIRAIVDAKDGKTHYLEVTNFFEVYTGRGNTVIDHYFENSVRFAISKKHWYRNNALFIVSSLVVDDQHVIRFQMPFANEARICKHLKAAHNLEKEYYEAGPAEFLRLFNASTVPEEMRASAE